MRGGALVRLLAAGSLAPALVSSVARECTAWQDNPDLPTYHILNEVTVLPGTHKSLAAHLNDANAVFAYKGIYHVMTQGGNTSTGTVSWTNAVSSDLARWFRVHEVRESLAMYPYNHTGVALRLLPTLHVKTLRRIRDAGDLHRAVSDFARLLVELRERRTAPLRV
jgi:hypothetical protein